MRTVTAEQYDLAQLMLAQSKAGEWSYSPETLDLARHKVRAYERLAERYYELENGGL